MAEKKKTKKNVSFESFDDIDLNKKIDLEAGKDAVGVESKSAKESKAEATTKKAAKSTAPKKVKDTPPKQEELIRTTIDFPKSEHRKLKILAMEADMKLYQYLYDIIKDHLKKQK